jgi:tyrosyl-tRNA synthetase
MKRLEEKVNHLLSRRVVEIFPDRKQLRQQLESGQKLRLYFGVDPSSPTIHLGHAVVLKKLRQFQELGHEVILLIGDFTGRIGDPSGRTAERKPLTHAQVLENAQTYQEQAAKVLSFQGTNPAKVKFNSAWLDELTFKDVIGLTSHFTVQQMLERDMFQTRLSEGKPIGLHEFLYPVMQGYDSVVMDVDLEIGGTDQTFNMLAGRTLMAALKQKEKFVLTVPLLEGLDGRKMSKSFGNVIGVTEKPQDMFGKVMSIRDELIIKYFTLVTEVSEEEIKRLEAQLNLKEVNPMELKKKLAFEIVKEFHSEKEAHEAAKEFEKVFQKAEIPTEMPEIKVTENKVPLLDLLVISNLVVSRTEGRRLIEQGGVEINQHKVTTPNETIDLNEPVILRIGKRKFLRVKA